MIKVFKFIGGFLFDFIETIVTSLVIFVLIYIFLFQPHQVKGSSMEPNFHDKEYLLTNKITYRINPPQRGDVVIFKAPVNKNYDYIKRVIALPGEKISLKEGKIYINDQVLDEAKYLPESLYTPSGNFLKDNTELTVPENQYFVMGDNRPYSSDSREWGYIGKNSIVGKAWVRYWPPAVAGLIPKIAW